MDPDFSGYATKAGLKCTDGRTIMPNAFEHQDKMTVPLVYQHGHNEVTNVLGHAVLENRPDGVYTYGYFNSTKQGADAKELVAHGDIQFLSIYANQLVERAKQVFHGAIREVSLVLAGANPGAKIDFIAVRHSDGEVELTEDEAIITTGLELEHAATEDAEDVADGGADEATEDDATVQEVYDSLTDNQKELVHYMIGEAVAAVTAEPVQHSDASGSDDGSEDANESEGPASDVSAAISSEDNGSDDNSEDDESDEQDNTNAEDSLAHQEGNTDMSRNVFDKSGNGGSNDTPQGRTVLSHDQMKTIFSDAERMGSLNEAILSHAQDYGITDVESLFPNWQNVTQTPEFISRRMAWVATVIDGARHVPFSRIRSLHADITAEEARAKGYVKGNLKKNEIIALLKRVTTPVTVYKKQKLDRDDILDITDFDVVIWLKAEMRIMLEEELARAILIGDGREADDEDKIDETRIRPIAYDDDMYAHKVTVASNTTPEGIVESIIRSRKYYYGTGSPTFYTTEDVLTDLLMIKDKFGRYVYDTEASLAAKLRVSQIITVQAMNDNEDLLGVVVNMADYTIGTDRGGEINMFDFFDIDYNQQKYLMETRCSGALTKARSALVIRQTVGTQVSPTTPTFDPATNTLTVPTVAGVTYTDETDVLNPVVLTSGTHVLTRTTDVEATADTGYSFPHNVDTDWTFAYTA